MTRAAALAEEPPEARSDGVQQLVAVEAGRAGERRHAQEHADEGDALHRGLEVRPRGVARGPAAPCRAPTTPDPPGEDLRARLGRDRRPDRLGVGQRPTG